MTTPAIEEAVFDSDPIDGLILPCPGCGTLKTQCTDVFPRGLRGEPRSRPDAGMFFFCEFGCRFEVMFIQHLGSTVISTVLHDRHYNDGRSDPTRGGTDLDSTLESRRVYTTATQFDATGEVTE